MGSLVYANISRSDIEDRVLAHLQIVITEKLRRREPFMFDLPNDAEGRRSIWVSADTPIQFLYYGRAARRINKDWLQLLFATASGPQGLRLLPEPLLPEPAKEIIERG